MFCWGIWPQVSGADKQGGAGVSAIVSYRVADVKPLNADAPAVAEFPQRMLGQTLNAQDIVNLGGHFEAKDRAILFHCGDSWVLTLEQEPVGEEWNALPHGRDEGSYDTEVSMDRRLQRLFIP